MITSPSLQFVQACLKFQGRVLEGEYGHWCLEWDELPIDETCEEFEVCTCFDKDPEVRRIQETMMDARSKKYEQSEGPAELEPEVRGD